MNKKDKDEFTNLITDALNDVVIPALDATVRELKSELASKEDFKELSMQIHSLDRKFDAQQDRLDKHNDRIEALEKLHPQGKHQSATA